MSVTQNRLTNVTQTDSQELLKINYTIIIIKYSK